MKKQIVYTQPSTATTQNECSEKACATCFENRGCMFEQYIFALMHKAGESFTAHQQNEDRNLPISKLAALHSLNHATQKALTA
jgi:hypothetical protein